MPHDIPIEAGDLLAFTPLPLAGLKPKPIFTLRAATSRDKRFMRRLIREEGVERHSDDALRNEVRTALEQLWDAETCARHVPVLEDYWAALDAFVAERKTDPAAEWQYDAETEKAVDLLEAEVARRHRPYARMKADNAEAAEISQMAMLAVVIESVSGLSAHLEYDRGYMTLEGAGTLLESLRGLDPDGVAALELTLACSRRMVLDGDEEKNSPSPSPSDPPPPNTETADSTAKADGKSPASARSKKTRAAA